VGVFCQQSSPPPVHLLSMYVQRSHCVNTRHADTWYRPQNQYFNTTSIVQYIENSRRLIAISGRALIEEQAKHKLTLSIQ
jgi:hypothetical protein